MFAYCQNNPANYFDPSGNAAVVVCHVDESIPFGGGLGFLGIGGGGGVGYTAAAASGVTVARKREKSSEEAALDNLENYGVTLYKGAPVFAVDFLGDSAISIGVIIIGSDNLAKNDFNQTLNHEYGHFIHMCQIGPRDYINKAGAQSFIFAGLTSSGKFNSDYYYDLPWERTADWLGRVERQYMQESNTAATIYYCCTLVFSWLAIPLM